MKLLEYESKELFRAHGIPVPPSGGVIRSLAGLPAALKRAGRGPWVIKAQVLAGGRGKAGGIKLAKTAAEAREAAKARRRSRPGRRTARSGRGFRRWSGRTRTTVRKAPPRPAMEKTAICRSPGKGAARRAE